MPVWINKRQFKAALFKGVITKDPPICFSYTFSSALVFIKEKALFQYNNEEIKKKQIFHIPGPSPGALSLAQSPDILPWWPWVGLLESLPIPCTGQHLYSNFKRLIPSAKQTRIGCLTPGKLNPSISQRSKASINPRIKCWPVYPYFPSEKWASSYLQAASRNHDTTQASLATPSWNPGTWVAETRGTKVVVLP